MTRYDFLQEIWAPHHRGSWLFLAAKHKTHWEDIPVRKGKNLRKSIRAFFREHPSEHYDLYFCPNAFRSPSRKKPEALRTPYAWCDIDEADPALFVPKPSILWESSPGRTQALWIFKRTLNADNAQRVSKFLTYEFNGDQNGWSVTKVLRIPGTLNHKRPGKAPRVKMLRADLTPINPTRLLKLAPKARKGNVKHVDIDIPASIKRDPDKLRRKYRRQIKHRTCNVLLRSKEVRAHDRSLQVFIIITALANAKVPWADIACLVYHNPYFQSKHGQDLNALEGEIRRVMTKLENEE